MQQHLDCFKVKVINHMQKQRHLALRDRQTWPRRSVCYTLLVRRYTFRLRISLMQPSRSPWWSNVASTACFLGACCSSVQSLNSVSCRSDRYSQLTWRMWSVTVVILALNVRSIILDRLLVIRPLRRKYWGRCIYAVKEVTHDLSFLVQRRWTLPTPLSHRPSAFPSKVRTTRAT